MASFKLTYATMFNPPEEMHDLYDKAVVKVKAGLGKTYGLMIDNKDVFAADTYENRSPINTDWLLGKFQQGTPAHADQAIRSAKAAFPKWQAKPWQERVALVRRAADLIEERLYDLAVITTLNVGKNRFEALGDIQEAAELLRASCDSMEQNNGYVCELEREPMLGFSTINLSVMKPYGVWLVISPFNFPTSLTCGPAGAALVAGNTVVTKPSVETSWAVRALAECFRDAGLPDGVFNFVTGQNETLGQALLDHPGVDGFTFTGSYKVGMKIYRETANFRYPRPVILEMGGKNAAVVSRNADLERAAWGIARSGFGAQGQKCSAPSRVHAENEIYDKLVARVAEIAKSLSIGDPLERNIYLGPLVRESAYRNYIDFCKELSAAGKIVTGGHTRTEGALAKGYYCEPTMVTDVPRDHRLWKHEMFIPLVMFDRVKNLEEAFNLANDADYGLTGGFFGNRQEAQDYFNRIQVGVAYVNRAQGACTGAWPRYQSFGGWKASGCTGKGSGGPYYLLSYMREQSQTIVE